jgi:hypothetical protein
MRKGIVVSRALLTMPIDQSAREDHIDLFFCQTMPGGN